MSEIILKALMRLFAILADINQERDKAASREIVAMYLGRYLSRTMTREYLQIFENHCNELKGKYQNPADTKRRKRNAAHSVKVLSICQQINEELAQKEKIIVLLRLIEFIFNAGNYTKNEIDFINTLAEVFNVDPDDFKNLKAFILSDSIGISEDNMLYFSSPASQIPENARVIPLDGLTGTLGILRVKSVNTFLMRLKGTDTLYLRGQDVKPNFTYVIEPGSIIKGKKVAPIYYTTLVRAFIQTEEHEKITFTAKGVEFYFPGTRTGLQHFNFSETTGTLVGVMGGSGVGKSTLFGVLNGTIPPHKGEILINGHNIHTEKEKVKGLIGYIPQDDLLFEELTVFENLYYNACLCFSHLSRKEITEKVDKVLDELGHAETRNLKVGSPLNKTISGGQRKRLNIALELIREPHILFVDEPTSGLSSTDSEQVMLLLKELTLKNKLIIVNIHQPSSEIYKLFDKLLVMDKGGYVIYNGDPIEALTYFKKIANHVNAEESECPLCGNVNPEQLLQIVDARMVDDQGRYTRDRKISPVEWHEHFLEKIAPSLSMDDSNREIPVSGFKPPSRLKQFLIYFKRNVATKITNRQYLLLNLLEAPLLAIILAFFTKYTAGDVYFFSENKNFPGFLFMAVVVPLFLGMTVSAEEIIRDRKILQREKFLHLSWLSYLFSKTVFLFFLSALQTFTFVVIANAILEIHGLTFHYWLILFSLSFFANLIGLNISSGLDSVVTIYILIPLILIPQLLLSGLVIKFEDLEKHLAHKKYVPFIGDLIASRWAYEALAVEQFKNNPYQRHFFYAEMAKSDAAWYASFLLPELKKTLNLVDLDVKKNRVGDETKDDLEMIRGELHKMHLMTGIKPYEGMELLNEKTFDTLQTKRLNSYLLFAQQWFNRKMSEAGRRADSIYTSLVKEMGKEALIELKKKNHNQALSDMLLNRQEMVKIQREGNELLRKKDPVYTVPDKKNGRAHLYAPVKRLGNYSIPTFWFNNFVLWLMCLVLFICLYGDVIRKLLSVKPARKEE